MYYLFSNHNELFGNIFFETGAGKKKCLILQSIRLFLTQHYFTFHEL